MGPVKRRATYEGIMRGLGWERIHEPDEYAIEEIFDELTHEEEQEIWDMLRPLSWIRREIKDVRR